MRAISVRATPGSSSPSVGDLTHRETDLFQFRAQVIVDRHQVAMVVAPCRNAHSPRLIRCGGRPGAGSVGHRQPAGIPPAAVTLEWTGGVRRGVGQDHRRANTLRQPSLGTRSTRSAAPTDSGLPERPARSAATRSRYNGGPPARRRFRWPRRCRRTARGRMPAQLDPAHPTAGRDRRPTSRAPQPVAVAACDIREEPDPVGRPGQVGRQGPGLQEVRVVRVILDSDEVQAWSSASGARRTTVAAWDAGIGRRTPKDSSWPRSGIRDSPPDRARDRPVVDPL